MTAMTDEDWRETAYKDAFQKEITSLTRRLRADASCTAEDLEGVLKSLYIMDGQDWVGRGEVQNISLAASIAAYEAFIGELRAQKTGKKS